MRNIALPKNPSIKLLRDVTDMLYADKILGPYMRNLEVKPYSAKKLIEVTLFSLIRDTDTLMFTLLDNALLNHSVEVKSQISKFIISTLSDNNNEIEEKIRVKLLNSSASENVGLLLPLRNYFSALADSDNTIVEPKKISKSKQSTQPTIFSWNGSGVHLAQLLIVLREKKWIDFPYEKNNESFQDFVSRVYHSINFTSPYQASSLRRDLTSDGKDDQGRSLAEKHAKAFAGGDLFSKMKQNSLKRKRTKGAKAKRKKAEDQLIGS